MYLWEDLNTDLYADHERAIQGWLSTVPGCSVLINSLLSLFEALAPIPQYYPDPQHPDFMLGCTRERNAVDTEMILDQVRAACPGELRVFIA